MRAVEHSLQRHHGATEVLCVAGSGEPSDHPDFPDISVALSHLARNYGKRLVLLSNGDGFSRADVRSQLTCYDRIYVKWDPGVFAGSWRAAEAGAAHRRAELLSSIPDLRVQAMLFRSESGGNISLQAREAWIGSMRQVRPQEIHLTTVDRPPRLSAIQPVDAATMTLWRRASERMLGIPVCIFPARESGEEGAA